MVEPPWGIEPQTYALRVCRSRALHALPAPTAPLAALRALRGPEARSSGFHEGFHSVAAHRRIVPHASTLDDLPCGRAAQRGRWRAATSSPVGVPSALRTL